VAVPVRLLSREGTRTAPERQDHSRGPALGLGASSRLGALADHVPAEQGPTAEDGPRAVLPREARSPQPIGTETLTGLKPASRALASRRL
jgi:hypothetical protein